MNEYFSQLNDAEYYRLKKALAEITILVAGADGDINAEELAWAKKVSKIRTYKMNKKLLSFYQDAGINFQAQLDEIIKSYPNDASQRNQILSQALSEINPILAKLQPSVGGLLYKSFVSFAHHVANASGGVFGFLTINKEEQKVMNLPMIHPIASDEEEE